MSDPLERLTASLTRLATHYDMTGEWPETTLAHLTAVEAWSWAIPTAYGGRGLESPEQMLAYESIAAGCMTCLLILTQRDAACEYIANSENPIKTDLLPQLARHELMTTVGISQVTTSRQGGRPSLTARATNGGYILNGCLPWVTAAVKSDFIVTAAVVEQEGKPLTVPAKDAQQILAMVSCKAKGVVIDRPLQLMALQSSLTSEVHCKNVKVDSTQILSGPASHVVSSGRSTVKPLVVAVSGIGLARAMVKHIHAYAAREKGRLADLAEELEFRCEAVRDRLYRFAPQQEQPEEVPKTELRVAVNDLLVRLVVAILTFGKGSGFVRQMDAQRLAREALFFLVWSAPEDVRVATLAGFLNESEPTIKTMTY
jgi:butyryl-CoA dehydrogenase